jgi:chromosome partitioning protein
MKTIVLAATKGGTGKSTLATCLAGAAMHEGAKVAILDGDPQQSIAMWARLREAITSEVPSVYAISDIDLDVADLREEGFDYVFVDSPPGDSARLPLVATVADLVVIPVRASAFDVDAIGPAVDAAETAGKPFVFVLNAVVDTKGANYSGTVKALAQNGTVLEQIVRQRAAYQNAIALGTTGPEYARKAWDNDCATEIIELWHALKRRVSRTAVKAR